VKVKSAIITLPVIAQLEKGGGNDGPMGGEYFLMGLGGCFTSNLLAAIKSRSADVSNVELTINATLAENPATMCQQ